MMVMLDTNVLASAAATRGLCADVLRAVLAEHELVVREDDVLCKPGDLPAVKLKDKDDVGILSGAIRGEVNVIVTGGKDLQMVDTVAELKIMSPRQFWRKLTEESE